MAATREQQEKYPMHHRLKSIKDKSQTCHDFIEWLEEKGYKLKNANDRTPYMKPLIAKFLDIDLDILEDEKLQMLEELRGAQK